MIDIKEIQHVANLARLQMSDKEAQKFSTQLAGIFEHVAKITELDTSKIEPTAHAVALSNVFREDKVDHEVSQDKALLNAPDAEEGAFKVPRIV